MRPGYLILAVVVAGLAASLIGTGTIVVLDMIGSQPSPGDAYSPFDTMVLAFILFTIVSAPAILAALAVIALPVTIILHLVRVSGVVRDVLLLAGLPLLGQRTLDGAFDYENIFGMTYGILAAVCWAVSLRLLPVFKMRAEAAETA